MIELDQRKLDFLMPAIAALLALARPEGRGDVVDVAQHDVEQPAPAGGLEIGDGAFQHVAGAIELVIVAEVGPALLRLAPDIPAVEIAVGQLRLREMLDDGFDLRLDVGVAPVRQRIARRLDPFADVGIPEHLNGEVVGIARDAKRRRRLRHVSESRMPCSPSFLCWLGMVRQDRIQPLAPEVAFEAHIGKLDRDETGSY